MIDICVDFHTTHVSLVYSHAAVTRTFLCNKRNTFRMFLVEQFSFPLQPALIESESIFRTFPQ